LPSFTLGDHFGGIFFMVIGKDNSLYGWGDNVYGQMGIGLYSGSFASKFVLCPKNLSQFIALFQSLTKNIVVLTLKKRNT
jgi:alpha-tubulin suppressor-like RCC1 family protein